MRVPRCRIEPRNWGRNSWLSDHDRKGSELYAWLIPTGGLANRTPRLSDAENACSRLALKQPQVAAPRDLKQYKEEQDKLLNSYGWVDQQNGIVRIPIDEAMKLLLEKGLPVRGAAPGKKPGVAPATKPAP